MPEIGKGPNHSREVMRLQQVVRGHEAQHARIVRADERAESSKHSARRPQRPSDFGHQGGRRLAVSMHEAEHFTCNSPSKRIEVNMHVHVVRPAQSTL